MTYRIFFRSVMSLDTPLQCNSDAPRFLQFLVEFRVPSFRWRAVRLFSFLSHSFSLPLSLEPHSFQEEVTDLSFLTLFVADMAVEEVPPSPTSFLYHILFRKRPLPPLPQFVHAPCLRAPEFSREVPSLAGHFGIIFLLKANCVRFV